MKKVLVVAPQPFFALRGSPINVRAVVATLATAGYDVTLLTMPFGEDIQIPGVKILRIGKLPGSTRMPIGPSISKLFYAFLFFWETWRLTARERFDILQGVEEAAFVVGAVGIIRNIPYIADVDSCMPTQIRDSWLNFIPGAVRIFEYIEGYFFSRAKAAITVCEALTDKVARIAPDLPIYQIEDFPFAEALTVNAAKFAELKQRFVSDGRLKILYTGNLESYQGVELLVRSLARVLSRITDREPLLLIVVGGSPEQVQKFKLLAAELSISDAVLFEGERPAQEMGAYTAISDILVSPRLHGENVPLKLFTYLALKKPLVATRISSHTQIVDGRSVFLGDPTIDGLAEALSRAARSTPAELEEVAERGYRLIQENYSEQLFQSRLLRAFEELLPLEVSQAPAQTPRLVLAE